VKSTAEKHIARIKDYQTVFGTQHGQRVLYDLMNQFHVLHSTRVSQDSETIFREGERNVVIFIMSKLKQNPDRLQRLIAEQGEEE
jgi:hypothetical protein